MNEKLFSIRETALVEISKVKDLSNLEALETRFLGRKGELTEFLRGLGALAPAERKTAGGEGNELKRELEGAFAGKREELKSASAGLLAETEWLDVTTPGKQVPTGHLHPMTKSIREITAIFTRLGYNRAYYPDVEWDWYAFEALNMPKDHPARDDWETFFILSPDGNGVRSDPKMGKMLLVPHTSSGQIREMERSKPPIRLLGIYKCYRRQMDLTHTPMFHQFEGLFIDKDVSITHLKGTLDHFAREFFGPGRRTRLRPFHFRFTEPSFEVDISCEVCGGTGKVGGGRCRVCKEGWLELGGAGMVHPNVLRAGGIDPAKWGGFAFGWGIERVFSMKTPGGLDDIRLLYKNDLRFLEQF